MRSLVILYTLGVSYRYNNLSVLIHQLSTIKTFWVPMRFVILPRVEMSRENSTRVLSCTFSRVLEYSSTGDTLNLHK